MHQTEKMNLLGANKKENELKYKFYNFLERYEKKENLNYNDFDTLIDVIKQLSNDNKTIEKELEYLKSKAFIPKKKIQQITDQQIQEIKNLRKLYNLSYADIERKTKWSKYTISKVLNGHYDNK